MASAKCTVCDRPLKGAKPSPFALTEQFNLRLSKHDLQRLKELSRTHEMTAAQYVRLIIRIEHETQFPAKRGKR